MGRLVREEEVCRWGQKVPCVEVLMVGLLVLVVQVLGVLRFRVTSDGLVSFVSGKAIFSRRNLSWCTRDCRSCIGLDRGESPNYSSSQKGAVLLAAERRGPGSVRRSPSR